MATRKSATGSKSGPSSGKSRQRQAKKAVKVLKKKVSKASGNRKGTRTRTAKKSTAKKKAARGPSTKKSARKKKVGSDRTGAPRTAAGRKNKKKKTIARKTTRKASATPKRGSGAAGAKKARTVSARSRPAPRRRLESFSVAVKIYEAAVRLMHAEKFERASAEFDRLISEYPNETELLDRANVLIQACDKRIQEARTGPKLKSANDYYEVGVAEMNSGALEEARGHLEHALEMLPRADHVLYALGALSALDGDREKALEYLSRSIERRGENRFLAANDVDFESLAGDPDFLSLVSSDS